MPIERFLRMFDFATVVISAVTLALQTATIGGIAFLAVVLRPCGPESQEIQDGCRRWIGRLGAGLAAMLALYVGLEVYVLAASTGISLGEALGANLVYAAGISVAGALSIVYLSSEKRRRGGAAMLPSAGLILLGAMLTSHAMARMEHRLPLAALTLLHETATAVWIGGLPFLLAVLFRGKSPGFLRETTQRFSRVALVSVCILVLAGLGLAVVYVGSWSGLYETAYGAMLSSKLVLFGFLLTLGALNFFTVRRSPGNDFEGMKRVRSCCEAEIGIGLAVLIAAASLTSQPPSADENADRLTASEIAVRLSPEWPDFTTPTVAQETQIKIELPAGISPGDPGYREALEAARRERWRRQDEVDAVWSNFNHHWAGLIVAAIGLAALLARTRRVPLARNWPLLFLCLAVFLFFRDDPEAWPVGHIRTFWESWLNPEDLQHRAFVVLVILFGIFEWRVQTGRMVRQWPALVFPSVCLLGGAALLTHSHSFGDVKEELFAGLSHLPIAVLAVLAGWSRWLELRLPSEDRAKSVLSWIWPVCFFLIGTVLLNYREV